MLFSIYYSYYEIYKILIFVYIKNKYVNSNNKKGYFGLDKSIRPGYTNIRYKVKVKSDASIEQLEELRQLAHELSPMIETVVNGVDITGSVEKI